MARRGGGESPVTFFSFQDVLLSLIGITIVITLILVIQATATAVKAGESARRIATPVAADGARASRIAALEFAVREAQKRPDADPLARRTSLRQELVAAGSRLEELEGQAEELAQRLREITLLHPEAGAVQQATELLRRRDEILGELGKLERRRRISYIVDRAITARPVLLELSAARIVACDLSADGVALRIAAGTPAAQVNDALEFYRNVSAGQDAYLLLVVKPSGLAQYWSLRAAIDALPEERRPRIGLDLIAEDAYVSELFPSGDAGYGPVPADGAGGAP